MERKLTGHGLQFDSRAVYLLDNEFGDLTIDSLYVVTKVAVSYLLIHHQELQLHCLKGLAFSATFFHLTRFRMHFIQLFILIILKSFI